MNAMNRYLVTASRQFVGSNGRLMLVWIGGTSGIVLLLCLGGALAAALQLHATAGLMALSAVAAVLGMVRLLFGNIQRAAHEVATAAGAWLAGADRDAVDRCQSVLKSCFRGDVRTKALHVLGLVAARRGDFTDAVDLEERALRAIPAGATTMWKHRARVLILSHRAVSLVAVGRVMDAAAALREANAAFSQSGCLGTLDTRGMQFESHVFGMTSVNAAVRELEPGRNPGAVLALGNAVVLAARGMNGEAIAIVERERTTLAQYLLPHERALALRVEARCRAALGVAMGGGPMRQPAVAPAEGAAVEWAERVLLAHA